MLSLNRSGRIESITYLRVLAVSMILYDHVGAMRNSEWSVKGVMDFLFCNPLKIIQEFGALGVSLFYLITGFLFFHTNRSKEKHITSALKKIVKIYCSVVFSFIGFGIFQWGLNFFEPTYWSQFKLKDWIGCATLINHFNGIGEMVNGTTWFLIPLFLFYLMASSTYTIAKKNVFKCMLCMQGGVILLFFLGEIIQSFGRTIYVFSLFPFVFIPIIGMILYAILQNEITGKQGFLLGMINYIMMVITFYRLNNGYFSNEPYINSVIYAVLLLLLFLIMDDRFKNNDSIGFIERISLSVYLVHMTWGGLFMSFLEPRVGFSFSFIISIILIVIVASVHYCVIETGILKRL